MQKVHSLKSRLRPTANRFAVRLRAKRDLLHFEGEVVHTFCRFRNDALMSLYEFCTFNKVWKLTAVY